MLWGSSKKTPQPKFQVHREIGCGDMAVLNLCEIQSRYLQTRIRVVITFDWLDVMTPKLGN